MQQPAATAPATAPAYPQQMQQLQQPPAARHEAEEDDEFGDFEDAPTLATTAATTPATTAATTPAADMSNPFDDFAEISTPQATVLPQKSENVNPFALLQTDSLPLAGMGAVKVLVTEPSSGIVLADDFGDFEQAADQTGDGAQAQSATVPSQAGGEDLFAFNSLDDPPRPVQSSTLPPVASEAAPFRGVDDDWKVKLLGDVWIMFCVLTTIPT